MYQYPKQILTIAQQVQSYVDAGMKITSRVDAENTLRSVGFYRLRGYSFHLYDNGTKKYASGTRFEDILKLYHFDQELSVLIFSICVVLSPSIYTMLCSFVVIYIVNKEIIDGVIDNLNGKIIEQRR